MKRTKRLDMNRSMRFRQDEGYGEALQQTRNTLEKQPISDRLIAMLKPLTEENCRDNPRWATTTVMALTNNEVDAYNLEMVDTFARVHNRPLVKWRLEFAYKPQQEAVEASRYKDSLYEADPAMNFFWCQGAPCIITSNINVEKHVSNGTHAVMHSLTFAPGMAPPELSDPHTGYCVVTLPTGQAPVSVNVSCKQPWAGHLAGNAHANECVDAEEHVIPLTDFTLTRDGDHPRKTTASVNLISPEAVMLGMAKNSRAPERFRRYNRDGREVIHKNEVRRHPTTLAFSCTIHKGQGQTLTMLIASMGSRPFLPQLSMMHAYVLMSRVKTRDGLRVMGDDWEDVLRAMRHSVETHVFDNGFDTHGYWSDERANEAMNEYVATFAQDGETAPRGYHAAGQTAADAEAALRKHLSRPPQQATCNEDDAAQEILHMLAKGWESNKQRLQQNATRLRKQEDKAQRSKPQKSRRTRATAAGRATPTGERRKAPRVARRHGAGTARNNKTPQKSQPPQAQHKARRKRSPGTADERTAPADTSPCDPEPGGTRKGGRKRNLGAALEGTAPAHTWPVGPEPRGRQNFGPAQAGGHAAVQGLRNEGRTCFVNSALQCLLHCRPLVEGLVACTHAACEGGTFCALCAMRCHALRVRTFVPGGTRAVTARARDILDGIGSLGAAFGPARYSPGNQMDAHEFLIALLDRAAVEARSPVGHLLSTDQCSVVVCAKCRNPSTKRESAEKVVSLPLGDACILSVKAALEAYTTAEQLRDENQYNCDSDAGPCGLQDATKRLAFASAPSVLILHLKRFGFDADQGLASKDNRPVTFGQTLDLKPHMTPDATGYTRYELSAVLEHHGGTVHGGHYTAYVRARDAWWCVSDSNVRKVKLEDVLGRQAYVLFYTQDAPAGGGADAATKRARTARQAAATPAAAGGRSAQPRTVAGTQAAATSAAVEREVERRLDEWTLAQFAENTCVLRVRRHTPHTTHHIPHTTHHTPHTTDRQELSDHLAFPPQVPVHDSAGPLGR